MTKALIQLLFITVSFQATAQVTNIPDPVFEQVLIDMGIDSDGTVNGQMASADALAITSLEIYYPDYDDYIYDLTGIEAFINVEELIVKGTFIEELNISTLTGLKYLDCVDNMLTTLDVSNNPLLEYLDISSVGDVPPFNGIGQIDLSNNPNINELIAWGNMSYINLKNGNNTADMHIVIHSGSGPLPLDVIIGHTCIEVDDASAAQNNQFPYSEWEIGNWNQSYSFAEDCNLSSHNVELAQVISVYPNPASDVVNIAAREGLALEKVQLYDISGRLVREYGDVSGQSISVNGLEKGVYILKVFTDRGNYSQRIIVE